jgi:hypothetical protein
MGATLTLTDTLNWAAIFCRFQQSVSLLYSGVGNEPAISSANTVIGTILGPPFCWPWNRNNTSFFGLTPGIQDYKIALSTFGFLEKCSIALGGVITATALTSDVATYTAVNSLSAGQTVNVVGCTNGSGVFNVQNGVVINPTPTSFQIDITAGNVAQADEASAYAVQSGGGLYEAEVKNVLGPGNEQARPRFVATQGDDNAGNISFRFLPVPDFVYVAIPVFQNAPPLFTSLTQTWAPVPDKFTQIYNEGLLSFMLEAIDDPRFQLHRQRFLASLIASAEGLSEMEKNIFLGNVLATNAQLAGSGIAVQQGRTARGT